MNQKGIIHIVTIVLLLLGLALAVYLVSSKQIFKSRAGGGGAIVVKDSSGNSLNQDPTQNLPITHSLNVQVNLNPPSK